MKFREARTPVDPPNILDEAATLIDGERQQTYGDVHDSFNRIAGLWSAYLGAEVTSLDVANLMILLKISRTKGQFHQKGDGMGDTRHPTKSRPRAAQPQQWPSQNDRHQHRDRNSGEKGKLLMNWHWLIPYLVGAATQAVISGWWLRR